MFSSYDDLGPPHIKTAGLCIWVLGREFDDSQDFWDGNWLRAVACCGADGAHVRVSGSILHLSEVLGWQKGIERVDQSLNGVAELDCTEPNLHARIELADGRGALEVRITPDHRTQQHRFSFEIDQSYLPELSKGLRRVLDEYPIRGQA